MADRKGHFREVEDDTVEGNPVRGTPSPGRGNRTGHNVEFEVRKHLLLEKIDALSTHLENWTEAIRSPVHHVSEEEDMDRKRGAPCPGEGKDHGLKVRDLEAFARLASELEQSSETVASGRRRKKMESDWLERIRRPWDFASRRTASLTPFERRLRSALLGFLGVMLSLLLWIAWSSLRKSQEIARSLATLKAKPMTAQSQAHVFAENLEAHRRQAEETVRACLTSENWRERLRYVRGPKAAANRMRDYYLRFPNEDRALTDIEILSHSTNAIENLQLHQFQIRVSDRDTPLVVPVVQQSAKEGDGVTFAVDWEAMMRYSPVPWRRFLDDRDASRPAVRFRLLMRLDDFFGFGYEPETHACLRIRDVENSGFAFAYLPLDGGGRDWSCGVAGTLEWSAERGRGDSGHGQRAVSLGREGKKRRLPARGHRGIRRRSLGVVQG